MKKYLKKASKLAWALMLMTGFCISRSSLHAQSESVIYERGYTQIENVLPPSPDAQSATKHAGIPVNLGTGMAELTVPVYTLTGRNLKVPVSLVYHSGGVKLDEIAGVAGLGWTLEAGGTITRSIVYMPDEYNNWSFYSWPSDELLEDLIDMEDISQNMQARNWLKSVLWRQKDSQADRYSYSVCGLSGSFIITPGKEVVHLSGDGALVKLHASDMTFSLIGPDGTKYEFAVKETGQRINMPEWVDSGSGVIGDATPMTGQPDSWSAPTAWHLSKMTSADGSEEASFTYVDAGEWNRNEYTKTWSWHDFSPENAATPVYGGDANATPHEHCLQMSYYPKVLTQINLNGDIVSFSYAAPPASQTSFVGNDATRRTYNFPKVLSGMTVNAGGGSDQRSWTVGISSGSGSRPVLSSLSESRGGDPFDYWSFSYINCGGTSCYSHDWYGYNNGESGRTNHCPYSVGTTGMSVQLTLSYGAPNAQYVSDGMLQSVDHNGAVSIIDYEPARVRHRNRSDSTMIGVRVHSIETRCGDSQVQTRTFTYGKAVPTFNTYPYLSLYRSVSCAQTELPLGLGLRTSWTHTLHEAALSEGANIEGARVVYGTVTEDVTGPQSQGGSARTVHHYDTLHVYPRWQSTIDRFPQSCLSSYAGNNLSWVSHSYYDGAQGDVGMETRKEVYSYSGVNHHLVSIEETEYDFDEGSTYFAGYTVHQVMARPYDSGGQLLPTDLYHYPVYAYSSRRPRPVLRTLVTVHGSGNDTTRLRYSYTGGITSPSRVVNVKMEDWDGSHDLHYIYPDNLLTGSSVAVDSLRARHMLSEPLERRYRRYRWEFTGITVFGTGEPVYVEQILNETKDSTTYGLYSLQGGGTAVLPSVRIERRNGVESWRETVLSRDCLGNIRSVKAKGSPETVLLWSYKGRYPVARVENASAADVVTAFGGTSAVNAMTVRAYPNSTEESKLASLRSLLSSAHVYTYKYEPGVGMTEATDPAGVTVKYEYDAAGRLKTIKDGAGKKVEEWTYNLLNPGTNRLNVRHKTYRTTSGNLFAEDVRWWNTLGLAQEDIALGASGDGRDLVSAYEGDYLLHDDVKTWQPYPVASTAGAFQTGAPAAAASFHDNALAYSLKQYEVSQREEDRVERTALPGYAGTHEEMTWDIGYGGLPRLRWEDGTGVLTETDPLTAVETKTMVTEDADGNQHIAQTDLYGKTLATARFYVPSGGSTMPSILTGLVGQMEDPTYYIYDDKDRLRAVAGSGIALTDTLKMWRYGYDALGRISSKGVPGAAREYYTYDNEDRIVAVQRPDALLETEYDDFGRVVKQWRTLTGGTRQLMAEYEWDTRSALSQELLGFGGTTWPVSVLLRQNGLLLCQKRAIMGADGVVDGYAETAYVYDEKSRLTNAITRFPEGSALVQNTSYDFSGNPTQRTEEYYAVVIQWSSSQSLPATAKLSVQSDYDLRARVTAERTELRLGGTVAARDTTLYAYDALGRPTGQTSSSGGITFSTEETYALQGWTKAHCVDISSNRLFTETLSRDAALLFSGFSPSYTGRITQASETWGDPLPQELPGGILAIPESLYKAYAYNHAGRLTKTGKKSLTILPPSGYITESQTNREYFDYDTRGNLTKVRNYTPGATTVNVSLYSNSGDCLTGLVCQLEPLQLGHGSGITPISSHTFTHDALGRMTYDGTGNLDIAYNHLHLPEKISRNDTVLVKYAYLSDGMKASTLNTAGAGLVYRGSMSFRKDSVGVLSFESAPIPAGRVTANGVRYHVTDHLGSVRAVVNGETGDLYEASDYAAYGHRTAASSLPNDVSVSTLPAGEAPSRWHFTGQEDQGPVSSSAAFVPNPANATLPYTDFGARHYSPSLLRWLVPDPLSEKYYDVSPYTYCAGDPVNLVDVDGRVPWVSGLVSAVADFSIQTGIKMIEGNSFVESVKKVDYSSVGASFVIGALSPVSAIGKSAHVCPLKVVDG